VTPAKGGWVCTPLPPEEMHGHPTEGSLPLQMLLEDLQSNSYMYVLLDVSEMTVHNNSVTVERALNFHFFRLFATRDSLGGKGLHLGKKNGAVVFFVHL